MLRCVPLAVGPPSSPVCFKGKQQGLTQRLRARGIRDTGRRSHAIPRQLSPFSSTGQSSHGVWPPRGSPLPAGHWQTSEGPTSAAALWEQRQALHLSCLDVKDTSRVASEAATAAVRAAAAAAAMTTAAATTTTAAAAAAAVAATQPYALRLRNIFRWGGVATVSADPHSSSSSSSSSGSSGLLFPSWGVRTPQEGLKDLTLGRAAAAIREAVEGCALLLWKGNKWRGTWVPNKWKWYHRHGYWATRKKLLKFDTYRRYRYHEVKGLGQPKAKWWAPNTHKSPLSQATKFW